MNWHEIFMWTRQQNCGHWGSPNWSISFSVECLIFFFGITELVQWRQNFIVLKYTSSDSWIEKKILCELGNRVLFIVVPQFQIMDRYWMPYFLVRSGWIYEDDTLIVPKYTGSLHTLLTCCTILDIRESKAMLKSVKASLAISLLLLLPFHLKWWFDILENKLKGIVHIPDIACSVGQLNLLRVCCDL